MSPSVFSASTGASFFGAWASVAFGSVPAGFVAASFLASGFAGAGGYDAFEHTVHGYPYALRIRLPPLAGIYLRRSG